MLVQFLSLFVLFCGVYCKEKLPVVETPLGQVQGYYKDSYGGKQFAAFEGIPYAKPPIGEKRFEESEPVKPWYGVWNATHPTECAQMSLFQLGTSSGDEDCLHINVYVPRKNPKLDENLDVVVHVHGGAYIIGSGHQFVRPDFIMDHNVIFVSFNYRLGILGFLSTEDDVVPGNNGLKDQTLALKWIHDNIASFGGNPNSVTLTGLSAGGSSVHLHYFSDRSKGLFHRGFSQSGFALNPWSIRTKPLLNTKKMAAAVGCSTSDTKIIVKCLKQRPVKHIFEQMPQFFAFGPLPFTPFGPVVEKAETKPFLKASPNYLLKNGQVYDVPWIFSMTPHEGLSPILMNDDQLADIDSRWNELAPHILEFNNTLPPSAWKATAQKIRQFYLGDEKMSKDNMMKVIQIFTDRTFTGNSDTALRLQAKANKSPVYFYLFAYPGDNNEHKLVSHGSDSKYFYTPPSFKPGSVTPNEHKMKDKLLKMLVSYAKTGEPIFDGVEWKPVTYDKLTYIKVEGFEPGEINTETAVELGNSNFWNSLLLQDDVNLPPVKDEF